MIFKKAFASILVSIALLVPVISSATTDGLNLFYTFELKVHSGLIDLTPNDADTDTADGDGHQLMAILSNTAPNYAWDDYSDVTEIASGHGYTTGGEKIKTSSLSQTSGTMILVIGANITWTASGGSMGPFRYVYVYDDTAAGNWLVGVWDFGSSITLTSGQPFILNINAQSLLTVVQ